ncbi:hypothetical protein [Mycolicibacterium fortuitum]|uniref:hypothetical protein n=1 Tax=Mycolicibacterium fortuitum TaxID=1766 RepID=UPI002623A919|nr:hypothetical protein [Mycolicibacterium fortuitum]
MKHIWCPACGLFGRRLRLRNRRAADNALIRFHAQLAAESLVFDARDEAGIALLKTDPDEYFRRNRTLARATR